MEWYCIVYVEGIETCSVYFLEASPGENVEKKFMDIMKGKHVSIDQIYKRVWARK